MQLLLVSGHSNSKCLNLPSSATVHDIYDACEQSLCRSIQYLEVNGRALELPLPSVESGGFLVVRERNSPLVAGKGGFGALLKSSGGKGKKSTSNDACRDLSGRRIASVKFSERMQQQESAKAEEETQKRNERAAQKRKLQEVANKETFDGTNAVLQKKEATVQSVCDAVSAGLKQQELSGVGSSSKKMKIKKIRGGMFDDSDSSSEDGDCEEGPSSSAPIVATSL